jgi:hypothetical protein
MVPKYTGKDMAVRFGTFSVAGAGRQLEVSQSADEIDVTTYGSTDKEFLAGFIDRSATLDILDDSTNSAIRNAFKTGTSNSLAWFPIGVGTGNPKFNVEGAPASTADPGRRHTPDLTWWDCSCSFVVPPSEAGSSSAGEVQHPGVR